ncbi:MAG: hypothetical protein A2Y16_02590 [Tenericutes bacterium GWF2_57_13]|nr:MAG: hypothetical protein A2Y16_02590 [Tenericutes bacterium GWF2_57_13]
MNPKAESMKNRFVSFSGIFAIFLVWIAASAIVANPMLLPTPWKTAEAFFEILTGSASLLAIGATVLRLTVAMGVATVLGLSSGIAAGLVPDVYRFLRPVVTVLRTVPVISIVVIVLIVFGFASTPYVITFLMVFPILFQAAADGIRRIDPELVDVFKLEDGTLLGGLRHCYLPLIAADIRTALLQAAGLGVKVLVMAEYLAQTPHSVGNALYLAKVELDFGAVFAWTALLVLMAGAIEVGVRLFASEKTPEINGIAKKRSITD